MTNTSHIISLQTGDIACFHGNSPFSRAIQITTGYISHVGFIACEDELVIYHAAKGWSFRQSFIREPLRNVTKDIKFYARLRYGSLFDVNHIYPNIEIAHKRAQQLEGQEWPYDWPMILSCGGRAALGIFGVERGHKPAILNRPDATMCSEAIAAHIWNPAWMGGLRNRDRLNLFTADPLIYPCWVTPNEIATSPNVVLIQPPKGDEKV